MELVMPSVGANTSAQSLLTLVTLGFGNLIGTKFCGWMMDYYTHPGETGPVTNWSMVFVWPGLLTLLCAIAFGLTFREPPSVDEVDIATEVASSLPPISAEEA